MRIPSSGCLTCGGCTHSASVRELQNSLGEKEWLAALGFALMLERGPGGASCSSSWWGPYLASLPSSEPGVVMMWPVERRRHLAGTEVEQALRDERAQARIEWDRHVRAIVERLDKANDSTITDADATAAEKGATPSYTFEEYCAARSVVSSRAFTINPTVGVGLVPIADLFNHRTGGHHVHLTDLNDEEEDKLGLVGVVPEEEEEEEEAGRDGGGDINEGERMFMKVVKMVNQGEEMFNTYGELGNAKLLCSYGFTQIDNPADDVTIGVPALRAAAALCGVSGSQITTRLSWCETKGVCDDESMFHLRPHSTPPDALLLVLWALAVSDESFDVLRKDKATSITNTEIVPHYTAIAEKQGGLKEERALRILLETLRRRRALYKGVPEDGVSEWKSNISVLLDSEDEILRNCEKYLEENMQREEAVEKKKRRCDSGGSEPGDAQQKAAAADAFSLFD